MRTFWKVQEMELSLRKCITKGASWWGGILPGLKWVKHMDAVPSRRVGISWGCKTVYLLMWIFRCYPLCNAHRLLFCLSPLLPSCPDNASKTLMKKDLLFTDGSLP